MEENTSLFLEDEEDLRGVTLSAVDILQQKFAVKFRGYDVQDVDSFLEVVAKEFERLHSDGSRS
ncbi:MAG: DivIVA domain-containing protein, partial [Deltaproteobacteria bacterium]|nr:DivIVA domain-containing protein [Deltaproteobacteria bacterium]